MHTTSLIAAFLKPKGKTKFLLSLPNRCSLLDVGCGNNSPYKVKKLLPSSLYTGLDVDNYNQAKPVLADRYILVQPADFVGAIANMPVSFDAIVSNHNLEHCDDPYGTLKAMIGALRKGGYIFIAFPSRATLRFPSRRGCLNYRDDDTHQFPPPIYDQVLQSLQVEGVDIVFAAEQYKPKMLYILGFFLEPVSKLINRVLPGTWAYYGFESVIWGKKH